VTWFIRLFSQRIDELLDTLEALPAKLTSNEWLAAVLYGVGWTGLIVSAALWLLVALQLARCP
jgi:hypothetical protein